MSDVTIKIVGLQVVEETGDTVETMVPGKHYIKGGKHYLLYDEIDPDNGETTKNTIKFTDSYAEVIRKGTVNARLVFEEGKNNQSIYSTPFGELLVEVLTKDIKVKESETDVNLNIDYELYANNSKVSDSNIDIKAISVE